MKQLEKTPFIRSVLSAAVGADVDVDNLSVFEAIATSTIPLRGKDGTIFERAVIAPVTLHQLAQMANNDSAPLMQDHNMNGTPKGKVFYGEVMPQDSGHTELRSLFYVDPSESELLAKVDNGTADEVSIAFLPEKINCSQCGFDYKAAADAGDILPILTRECPEGHKVAEGANVILNGATDLLELSVVSRGAAKNSKIIGQSNAKLGSDVQRLAANGLDINQIFVTASADKGQNDMGIEDLVIKLSDTKADLAVALRDKEQMQEELAAARGARAEADKRVAELESELATAKDEAEEAPSAEEREVAKKDRKTVEETEAFLSAQYTAVLTAAGKTDIVVPDTVQEMIAGIKEHQAELSAVLPIGGRSVGAGDIGEETNGGNLSQFKLKNR